MEAVETQSQATEQKKGTVKVTVCLSLSGVAEGGLEVYKDPANRVVFAPPLRQHPELRGDRHQARGALARQEELAGLPGLPGEQRHAARDVTLAALAAVLLELQRDFPGQRAGR